MRLQRYAPIRRNATNHANAEGIYAQLSLCIPIERSIPGQFHIQQVIDERVAADTDYMAGSKALFNECCQMLAQALLLTPRTGMPKPALYSMGLGRSGYYWR